MKAALQVRSHHGKIATLRVAQASRIAANEPKLRDKSKSCDANPASFKAWRKNA